MRAKIWTKGQCGSQMEFQAVGSTPRAQKHSRMCWDSKILFVYCVLFWCPLGGTSKTRDKSSEWNSTLKLQF